MTNCPSEATLRLIGTDAVGEATFVGLEAHVGECPDCQKIAEAVAKVIPQAATHSAAARNIPPTRRRLRHGLASYGNRLPTR